MILIAESESFDKLRVIIGGVDAYAAIRLALDAYVNVKIEDMSPEDRLLDAIFNDDDEMRAIARKLIKQLREQEELLPLFIEASKVGLKRLDEEEKELIKDCKEREKIQNE